MTLEARPNQPQNPEGILPQLQERFVELQSQIVERLRPDSSTIIVTSDSNNPPEGYHLALDKEGHWCISFAREGVIYLNGPNKPPDKPLESLMRPPEHPEEPVEFIEILKRFAFIQNSSRFDEMARPGEILKNAPRRRDEMTKLEESVENNPGPFAESFLTHMQG